jgi:hypothetical protein
MSPGSQNSFWLFDTQTGPKKLKRLLSSPEEIEAELSRKDEESKGG